MYKIFKYPSGYEKGKLYYFGLPGKVIRTGWVEDNQYKGYWVWVIVNPQRKDFQKIFVTEQEPKDISGMFMSQWIPIGIIEEQEIETDINAIFHGVSVYKGFINLGVSFDGFTKSKKYKIVGYKTGQDIPYPPSHISYIGFAPLVIKDEISIYFFLVLD